MTLGQALAVVSYTEHHPLRHTAHMFRVRAEAEAVIAKVASELCSAPSPDDGKR